ncbi:MAG: diguanylate cyclase domain-containing protein [Lachnospirales bacterium]
MLSRRSKDIMFFSFVSICLTLALFYLFGFLFPSNNDVIDYKVFTEYEEINDYFYSKIEAFDDSSISRNINVKDFDSSNPLKIGVSREFLYYFSKDTQTYGIFYLYIDILENYFDIPIEVSEYSISTKPSSFDIVLTSEYDDVLESTFLKSPILYDSLYIYGLSPYNDLAQVENSTFYLPKKYETGFNKYTNIVSSQKGNQLLITDNDFTYDFESNDNEYYVSNKLYALQNPNTDFDYVNDSNASYTINAYYNNKLNTFFVNELNDFFNNDYILNVFNDYYNSILQVELSNNTFFTKEEVDFINQTYENPLVFDMNVNQSILDSELNGNFKGPTYNVWNKISKLTNLSFELNVRSDKNVKEILNNLNAINGTLLTLNLKEIHDNHNNINLGYSSNLVLIEIISDNNELINKRINNKIIGIADSYIFNEGDVLNIYNLSTKNYNSIYDGIEALKNEDIDFFATTYDEFQVLISQENYYNLEINTITDYKVFYTSLVNNDYSGNLTASIANKALLVIDSNKIFNSYIKNENTFTKSFIDMKKRITSLNLANTIFIVVVVSLIAFIFNLHRRLTKTSKELSIIENVAYEDSLTALKNQIAFTSDLDENYIKGTIFVVNINDFRNIDVKYSHKTGNYVLKNLSYTLLAFSIEHLMQVYRVGNDTFALTTSKKISYNSAMEISKDLINAAKTPIEIYDLDTFISIDIRIGVSAVDENTTSEIAYYRAETASIDAKKLFENNKLPVIIDY